MNTYRLRFISGPQEALRAEREHRVSAASPAEALGTVCRWPVQSDSRQTCAWARHPGTSLYDVAAWEAQLLGDPPSA